MSENGNMGDNSGLSEDHLRALGYHHKGQYERALATKKKADADLKNSAKRALADGVTVDDIKLLMKLDEPGGEAELRSELNRRLQVARWAGSEIGTQFSFLDEPDRTPLNERAYEAGKVAGFKGETASAPHDGEPGQEWLRGWHDGQAGLADALELTKERAVDAESANGGGEPKKRGRPKGSKNRRKNAAAATAEDADPFADEKVRDAESFEGNPAPPYA